MNYVGVGQWWDGLLKTLRLAAGGGLQRGGRAEQQGDESDAEVKTGHLELDAWVTSSVV